MSKKQLLEENRALKAALEKERAENALLRKRHAEYHPADPLPINPSRWCSA